MESSKNSDPVRIIIGIPTMHERMGWICPQLFQWTLDLPYWVADGNNYQYTIAKLHNHIPAAAARNYFFHELKDSDPAPDWLMMIDNDMAPPLNLLDTIKGAPEDAMVVVPQFQMWDETRASVRLCWGMDDKIAPPLDDKTKVFTLEYGKFYPLTKAGTGAIFIRPKLFESLELPYFEYPYNKYHGMEATEDIVFTNKVLTLGYKIYGNSSISVGHYHNVNLDVMAKHFMPRPIDKVVETCNKGIIGSECPSDPASPAVSR